MYRTTTSVETVGTKTQHLAFELWVFYNCPRIIFHAGSILLQRVVVDVVVDVVVVVVVVAVDVVVVVAVDVVVVTVVVVVVDDEGLKRG